MGGITTLRPKAGDDDEEDKDDDVDDDDEAENSRFIMLKWAGKGVSGEVEATRATRRRKRIAENELRD